MPFAIIKGKTPDRLITMGQAAVEVAKPMAAAAPIPEEPKPPIETKTRRTKMAEDKEKIDSRTGVDTTREDDAGAQGPIGSPAPEKAGDKESEGGKEE